MPGLNRFHESLKREVVFRVRSGDLSQAEAMIEYGIKGHSTVLNGFVNLNRYSGTDEPLIPNFG